MDENQILNRASMSFTIHTGFGYRTPIHTRRNSQLLTFDTYTRMIRSEIGKDNFEEAAGCLWHFDVYEWQNSRCWTRSNNAIGQLVSWAEIKLQSKRYERQNSKNRGGNSGPISRVLVNAYSRSSHLQTLQQTRKLKMYLRNIRVILSLRFDFYLHLAVT